MLQRLQDGCTARCYGGAESTQVACKFSGQSVGSAALCMPVDNHMPTSAAKWSCSDFQPRPVLRPDARTYHHHKAHILAATSTLLHAFHTMRCAIRWDYDQIASHVQSAWLYARPQETTCSSWQSWPAQWPPLEKHSKPSKKTSWEAGPCCI